MRKTYRKVTQRSYKGVTLYNNDYHKIHSFLVEFGGTGFNSTWHWGRFAHLMASGNMNKKAFSSIGIWECKDKIVGLVLHDGVPGEAYFICRPGFECVKADMISFAKENINDKGITKVAYNSSDSMLKKLLTENSYKKTTVTETILSKKISRLLPVKYNLSSKYSITSYAEEDDYNQYKAFMHKAFTNNDSEYVPIDALSLPEIPYENKELKVFAVDSKGEYLASCSAWFVRELKIAYIDEYAVLDNKDSKELLNAVVSECTNRCAKLGATSIQVISSDKALISMGFEKIDVEQFYKAKC